MLYVNQWMTQNKLPKGIRAQVRRYLEYQWELKKEEKIEESDVLKILNDDLRDNVLIYMNGKFLKKLTFQNEFGEEFLS